MRQPPLTHDVHLQWASKTLGQGQQVALDGLAPQSLAPDSVVAMEPRGQSTLEPPRTVGAEREMTTRCLPLSSREALLGSIRFLDPWHLSEPALAKMEAIASLEKRKMGQ